VLKTQYIDTERYVERAADQYMESDNLSTWHLEERNNGLEMRVMVDVLLVYI